MTTATHPDSLEWKLDSLPKAELHLHLEGSIAPATVAELAARHGLALTAEEAAARYRFPDFNGFLEAFKWVTSLLRTPADYALITERLAEELLAHNVVYAELTVSVGVMLRRGQNVEANLTAMREAAERARPHGLRVQWIFDAVRQFGPNAAMEVAQWAIRMKPVGVVAFGIGGDELALPASEFRAVYDAIREAGLHPVIHAGEIGGPESMREAVELLGVERIGHGIAACRDPELIATLAGRKIALELCLTSNLRTGALAQQLGRGTFGVNDHPLRQFYSRGIRVTISTDDPAMFGTNLTREYIIAQELGFSTRELARLAGMSYEAAFLSKEEKEALLAQFRPKVRSLGLV